MLKKKHKSQHYFLQFVASLNYLNIACSEFCKLGGLRLNLKRTKTKTKAKQTLLYFSWSGNIDSEQSGTFGL